MIGEFSQFEENLVHFSNLISSLAAGLARVQVNLVVDPVLHGWTKEFETHKLSISSAKRVKTLTSSDS